MEAIYYMMLSQFENEVSDYSICFFPDITKKLTNIFAS